MADPTGNGIKAGEAYLRAIANDPKSKRAVMRTRAYLQTFIRLANIPEIREALEGHLQVSQEYADALRDNMNRIGDDLGALHLPRPETVEDWQVLGRIVEIPEEYLQAGSWTAAEIYDRATAWGQREKIRAKLAADAQAERANGRSDSVPTAPRPTKAKRSTERGEGRAKLIAALAKHHKYAESGCLNLEPVGNNELARSAEVSKRTASAFFDKEFGGHLKYRSLCQDAVLLAAALKALNGEFRPRDFYDTRSPDDLDQMGDARSLDEPDQEGE
ncbi:MAG: hypothetical protein DWQ37_06305 [Planctomycetota bacterium]|nr:MAG: hypothetical protein DWQ37_06305 [Planctomycetota bacterium]